jgi:hypothetical protein
VSFDPDKWLHDFVLPLVAGGDVRVATAIGARELETALRAPELSTSTSTDGAIHRIAEARHDVVSELVMSAPTPILDETSLRLAAAVQDLLFLAHPGAEGAGVRRARLRALSAFAVQLATLALPPAESLDAPRLLAERHSMLHHLFDLGRDDVRVSFWVGKREFRGAEPPARLLKWPELRRVREERWRVAVASEAMSDARERPIIVALLRASPLTDLLEPSRLEPRFDLLPLAPWLRQPAIARAVADRYLSAGLSQIGGAFAAALMALYNDKDPRARSHSRTATAFACHLQLLSLIGKKPQSEREHLLELQGIVQAQPGLRDFYGLFAAAQRAGFGRPSDVARDPRLRAEVDAYASACAALVGHDRLLELGGVMSRALGLLQVSS